jgi:hypothetical protein
MLSPESFTTSINAHLFRFPSLALLIRGSNGKTVASGVTLAYTRSQRSCKAAGRGHAYSGSRNHSLTRWRLHDG